MRILTFFVAVMFFAAPAFADFSGSFAPDTSALDSVLVMYQDRINLFIADAQASSVFGVPSQLSSSVFPSGSPTITLELGDTFGGSASYDFNNLGDSTLVGIRAFLLLVTSLLAVQHVLRGGGG